MFYRKPVLHKGGNTDDLKNTKKFKVIKYFSFFYILGNLTLVCIILEIIQTLFDNLNKKDLEIQKSTGFQRMGSQ